MKLRFAMLVATLFAAAGVALAPAAAAQEQKAEKKDEKAAEKKGLPLKPERKVEFTTDEGTWLSLDVSPDGKTIAMELLGQIYTLPIEGGQAKAVTSGLEFDRQPKFSPDGKWIAFISDREGADNLWIMHPDGSDARQLSKDQHSEFASPAWTPDGQYVVVSRAANSLDAYELWMYHMQGGAGIQINKAKAQPTTPRAEQINSLGPAASPDGKYLYFARKRGGFAYNIQNFPLWQIARRDLITGDEDIITRAPGSAFRPVLSPDGKLLVYGTRFETKTGLRIRNLVTGEDRWLKYPVQRDDQESRSVEDVLPTFAFTPDGKSIVATWDGKLHRLDVAAGADAPIPFTAQVSREIGPSLNFPARVEEGPVRARIIQRPVASPDGKRVAFSALTHLWVMDLPPAKESETTRGTPRRVTRGDAREYQPSWSPDGQWLAYVTWTAEGGAIWKARADGSGEPVQLTRAPEFYSEPVWSPDGARIVALRAPTRERDLPVVDFGEPAGMDLIWIPSDGGDAHLIIPARGVGRPHFTDEPDRIYVYSNQGLISLRYDGTDRRTHVKIVGKSFGPEPERADDVRMSPDGTKALALVAEQLWVALVPRIGGEAPTVNVNSPSVPVKRLTDVGADYIDWADRGQTITWGLGASFFRQPLGSVKFEPAAPPEKKEEEKKPEEKAKLDVKADDQPAVKKPEEKKEEKKPLYAETEAVIEVPRHTPRGSIVLRGARVITMRSDEVIENADLVVTDNRIAGVGRRGAVKIPAGAKIFDVAGQTIIPGLVDIHAHWFEIRRDVLDLQAWPFLANLAFGVTSGRDPQTATNDMFAYQDLIDAGEMLGPRAFSTGPGVFLSTSDFQSADEARNIVAKYKRYYHTNTLKSYMVGNRKQREWMVMACKENQVMPTTEGALDLKLDLTHAIDGFSGNEHALPIVPLYKDVVELYARSGIHYTPTLLVLYGGPWAENYFYETTEVHENPKLQRFVPHTILDAKTKRRPWFRSDEHSFSQTAAAAAKILRAGGHVQIGGHGQIQGIQDHWELWALASGGLSPMEALRVATINGAEAIGYAQDLGSIEPGKLADLVVLSKNPLEDIHNTLSIRHVMKNGELFDGDTLDQLWPVQKKLPPLWWWNDKP